MRALVTGGLGFIGSHLVEALVGWGWSVRVLDNKSRPGAVENLRVLTSLLNKKKNDLWWYPGDVRDASDCRAATKDVDIIFHLAAQVAVTTSVQDPRADFETNALGTLNVLEAVRACGGLKPPVLFASTNKVYGDVASRWGTSELAPIRFASPYGCSKGAADQYVQDYARTYGLRTGVLRMSCIYGPRQYGCEDQGWLAWFAIAASLGRNITIYGDGSQVRDVLHVRDCVDAWVKAGNYLLGAKAGTSLLLNVGGGPANAITVLDGVRKIREASGWDGAVEYGDWRRGDQHAYVSDVTRAEQLLGWKPRVPAADGIEELVQWARDNRNVLEEVLHDR